MSLLDSEEWVAYALNLVDELRGYGLHDAFLEPEARHLENALVASFSGGDLPGLTACARGGDPAEALAAVRLLARLVLSGDPRLADGAADVTRTLRAVTESAYPERTEGRLALLGWLEAAPREAGEFLRRHAIEDVLPLDAEVRCPLAGGGELALEPGRHVVRINLVDVPPCGYEEEDAWLLARVDIADSTGRVWRAHRPFGTHAFIEMLRKGQPVAPGEGPVVLPAIRCFSDHRQWLPVVEEHGGQAAARAYTERYLNLSVTVRRHPTAPGIVLDVAPQDYGSVEGGVIRRFAVGGHLIAKDLLLARTWSAHGPHFHLTDEFDESQPGVRLVDGRAAVTEAQQPSAILEAIALECIQSGQLGRLHLCAGWLAGIRLDAAEALLLPVDPASQPRYGDEYLLNALAHLVRRFGSGPALARLRQLAAAAGPASDRAHIALAQLGHADSARIERELEKWRQTRSGESAEWLSAVGSYGIKVQGAAVAGVLAQVQALLGQPSQQNASSLTYESAGGSHVLFNVEAQPAGRDLFQARFAWSTVKPGYPAATRPPADATRAAFAVSVDVLFATDDGRQLRIGSAGATVTVRLEGEPPWEIRPDTSSVLLAVYLSDAHGRTFKATRPLTASLLLDAWRAGEVGRLCPPDQLPSWHGPSVAPVLDEVKIFWPEARLVVAGPTGPQLLELSGRETAAELHPGASTLNTILRLSDDPDGLGGFFTVRPLAMMVLMPSLLGAHADLLPPVVLVDTGRIEAPTPGVRLEPS